VAKKQDNISTAVADCREAWNQFFVNHGLPSCAIKFEDGSPIEAWCLHHEVESEKLSEPIENRISYILSNKPKHEQACRFINLRPMSIASQKVKGAARAEYQKVKGAVYP
jgi:hypothetical protein